MSRTSCSLLEGRSSEQEGNDFLLTDYPNPWSALWLVQCLFWIGVCPRDATQHLSHAFPMQGELQPHESCLLL